MKLILLILVAVAALECAGSAQLPGPYLSDSSSVVTTDQTFKWTRQSDLGAYLAFPVQPNPIVMRLVGGGVMAVEIARDGEVKFGDVMTKDQASRDFWRILGRAYPELFNKPVEKESK